MARVKQYAVAASGQWTDEEESRRRGPRLGTGLEPDRLRAVPQPLPTDPLPARRLAGHLPGVRGRGGPGAAPVPALRLGRRAPWRRRPPTMAPHQPPAVSAARRAAPEKADLRLCPAW